MIVPNGSGVSPAVFCKFLLDPDGRGLGVILSIEEGIARLTVENIGEEEVTATVVGLTIVVIIVSSVVVEVIVALALVVIEGVVEVIVELSSGIPDIKERRKAGGEPFGGLFQRGTNDGCF
jgi:hypothetical protein